MKTNSFTTKQKHLRRENPRPRSYLCFPFESVVVKSKYHTFSARSRAD
uniref:Uncharacterized protein n=1 Tax=Rhizophora mucronata TaxID=61149 RepID=A0A2P2KG79_RHIMU